MAQLKRKIMFVFGTRPEAIKLAPVIKIFQKDESFQVIVCVTAQHTKMLYEFMDFFKIKPDYNLEIMKHNQPLEYISDEVLRKMDVILWKERPEFVCVQGDTTTAFASALAAYYKRIKIIHIEAGLRTYDKYAPFPEETNRRFISCMADYHFAPTAFARKNLYGEGIKKNVFVTGNTVVDALIETSKCVEKPGISKKIDSFFCSEIKDFKKLILSKKLILITFHRRESFGEDFENILTALKTITERNNVFAVYPVHLNPNVQFYARKILEGVGNVFRVEPLGYKEFIWLMKRASLVLTDSGGIQEEATTLGKPLLIARNVTERQEAVSNAGGVLGGTGPGNIIREAEKLLHSDSKKIRKSFVFGRGDASSKILRVIKKSNP